MSKIAIITARGNSKRIPKKNIKSFCGKPIIAYSIQAALDSGIFDTVMVSTDSFEIKSIAEKYGAEVPFMRSSKNSDDYATTADVLLEVINWYEINGKYYDYGCCVYPTAPLITSEKIKEAMETLEEERADSVIPVVRYSFPPQRGMKIHNGKISSVDPEDFEMRSQDLEPIYHDCGQFYVFKIETFKEKKKLVTDNSVPLVLKEKNVQDIDSIEDWEIAELKYKLLNRKKIMKEG